MPRFSSFANVHIVQNCPSSGLGQVTVNNVPQITQSYLFLSSPCSVRENNKIVHLHSFFNCDGFFKSERFPTLRKMMSSTRTFKFNCGYSLCTSHHTDDPRATQHRLNGLPRFRHASSSFSDAEHHHAIFLQLFVIIGALAKSTRTFAAPSPRGCCTSPRPARVSNAMRSAPPL